MDILVLEDDPPIADFIAEALRDEGYNPHVAHTVSTAIAAIENSIPQLILLDLNIPTTHESNAFLAYWRSSSAHGVPIILITASSRVPALELLGKTVYRNTFTIDLPLSHSIRRLMIIYTLIGHCYPYPPQVKATRL